MRGLWEEGGHFFIWDQYLSSYKPRGNGGGGGPWLTVGQGPAVLVAGTYSEFFGFFFFVRGGGGGGGKGVTFLFISSVYLLYHFSG